MKKTLRQIVLLFRPVRSFLPVYVLAMIIVGSRNLVINYLTAFLESAVAGAAMEGEGKRLLSASLCFLAGVTAFVVVDTLGLYLHGVTTHQMTLQLKRRIHQRVIYSDLSAFTQAGGGKSEVLSRLNQDVGLAKEIYSSFLLTPLMWLISGTGAAVSVCARSAHIGLPLLLAGVVGLILQWRLGKRQRQVSRRMQQALAGILSVVNDLHSHGLTIRFAGLTDAFARRLAGYLGRYGEAGMEDACIQAELDAVGSVLYCFQYMGTILLGLAAVGRGAIEISDLFFIVQMSSLMLTAFSAIGSAVVSLQKALAGAERAEELM